MISGYVNLPKEISERVGDVITQALQQPEFEKTLSYNIPYTSIKSNLGKNFLDSFRNGKLNNKLLVTKFPVTTTSGTVELGYTASPNIDPQTNIFGFSGSPTGVVGGTTISSHLSIMTYDEYIKVHLVIIVFSS